MQHAPYRRRFIAGAVCPRCALMDKIVVDLDTDQRHCVSCGFSEPRPGLPATSPLVKGAAVDSAAVDSAAVDSASQDTVRKPAEIPTRVSRAAARRVETPAQVVTLIDPRKDREKPQG
jgi:uncharacterized metal-binding protein (TIGR02443 family)